MSTDLNRRNFARVALVAAAGLSVAADVDAVPPAQADKPTDTKRDTDETRRHSAAEHLVEVIRQRYPDPRLAGDALAAIHRDVTGYLAYGDRLRQIPLTNADEPGFTFAAFRNDAIR